MLRWLRLAAVCGVVLTWSNEAFAVVQNTDVAVTKPAGETGSATLTLTQKDSSNRTVKTDTIRVARTQPRARQNVRIDPDRAKTVDVTIETDRGRRTVTIDVATLLGGGPINLGEGFTLQGTPSTAAPPASRTQTFEPRRTTTPDRSVVGMNGSAVGQTGVGVDVGITGGSTSRPAGGSFIRGRDDFGGANLVDQRPVDLGGDAAFVGAMVNIWQVGPGLRFFAQTGVNVPIDASNSARQTGINTIPQGDATATVKYDWEIPVFFGLSDPIPRPLAQIIPLWNPRWRVGLGFVVSHGEVSISGADGAARAPFSASKSFTDLHPGILVGLRGGLPGGWILGFDTTFVWRDDKTVTAASTTPGFVQSYTTQVDGGVDISAMFSLSWTLGNQMPNTGYRMPNTGLWMSDVRVKRDIVKVGEFDNGLSLYRYRYRWSDQVYVGVMAHDVANVAPDAVVKGDDGYLRVDYARLGTSMKTWEQWSAERGWLSREAN